MQKGLTPQQRDLLDRLATLIELGATTQSDVARSARLHQSQVSRILSGQVHRTSKGVVRLCAVGARLAPERSGDAKAEERLMRKLKVVWDGSPAHAQALEQLLSALGRAQRACNATTTREGQRQGGKPVGHAQRAAKAKSGTKA
jgi:DNA-directed RNA polymerase specialized sigma54-like protein